MTNSKDGGMKQLAIIKGVGVGMRDCHNPVLWFSVYIGEGVGALIVLDWQRAERLIKTHGIHEVRDLEGQPCWVNCDQNKISFIDIAKI